MNPIKIFAQTLFSNKKKDNTSDTLKSLYHVAINSLQGHPIDLSEYKRRKILFVNVASKCGFTPQYKALQELYDTYRERLMIIGVPCNQFGGQESGTAQDIEEFCALNYGVSFLMTEKIKVKGQDQHPLYTWLTKKALNGRKNSSVKWNFQKYLVDEQGELIDYFYSMTNPMSTKITSHIN